jgi:hypothetical protein
LRYPEFDGSQPCASVGTDLFYPTNGNAVTRELRRQIHNICSTCHFQAQCLEWGIRHEADGIWGGLLPVQRADLRRQMGLRLEPVPVTVFVGVA